jgi:type II secretory pathway predicted ATPase ExeA
MYESFYGLTEKPFSIQPDPAFLYWGRGHRLAYAMLEYGVVNQAGISVITGEIGCGKTTLIHRLLDQLSSTHTIALLSNIQAGRGELLSWVLMGFGEPYAGKSHVEMFAQLQSFFIREYAKGKRVVLIIDEAQNLSVDMLEEIRMLSNINAGKDQLLQLILVGQPQLKDLLSRPDMLQLAQRIGSDFHLTPLSREEVHAYIDTRLTIAGARRNVFTPAAMDAIAEQSRGVPRVINIIADTALVYAFSAQEESVDADLVQTVIRDKLDYGVFGLASPDLELAESPKPRTGYSRDATRRETPRPKAVDLSKDGEFRRAAPEPRIEPRIEPREAPRMVANLGVRLAMPEPAESEPEEARPARPSAPPPPPRPPESLAAAPRPEPPVESAAEPAATPIEEIGVVIVGESADAVAATAHSAPDGMKIVGVAPTAAPAHAAGVEFVELNVASVGGGRARNAGYRRLKKIAPHLRYVQFVDAGALIDPDWFDYAYRFMGRRPEVAALEGRTVDVAPVASPLQRILNPEREEGELQATGPNAVFRADAFEAAGGFRGDIVADETADLCIRLRRRGAHVWRSDATMALAEPKALSFAEWRRQARRNGYRYAAGAALHGGPPERYCAREQGRALMWGGAFPLLIAAAAILAAMIAAAVAGNPLAAALFVLFVGAFTYALRIAATAMSADVRKGSAWTYAAGATLAHFFECAGVLEHWFSARRRAPTRRAAA